MDYFSVIVLVIVTLVFVSDRKVKSIDKIINEKTDVNLYEKIHDIKEKMTVIEIDTKEMDYDNLVKITQGIDKEYILLYNRQLQLTNEDIDLLIANYINCETPCGFNLLYIYQNKKWSLKKIYVDIINYLNIFNKKDFSTYGAIICKKIDLMEDDRNLKSRLISYTPHKTTYIEYNKNEIEKTTLKSIYISKIKEANIDIILKILLLIISGSIITTNLIYSILNINNNISNVIISGVIYYCYSYIIRYIYKPIGKQRIIATYIFPFYFIAYIIVGISTWCTKVIKKVHAS